MSTSPEAPLFDEFWALQEAFLRSEGARLGFVANERFSEWCGSRLSVYYMTQDGHAGLRAFTRRDDLSSELALRTWSQAWIDRCAVLGREPDVRRWPEADALFARWDGIVERILSHGIALDSSIHTSGSNRLCVFFIRSGAIVVICCYEMDVAVSARIDEAIEWLYRTDEPDPLPEFVEILSDPRMRPPVG